LHWFGGKTGAKINAEQLRLSGVLRRKRQAKKLIQNSVLKPSRLFTQLGLHDCSS
jgi:hypothetical protein